MSTARRSQYTHQQLCYAKVLTTIEYVQLDENERDREIWVLYIWHYLIWLIQKQP